MQRRERGLYDHLFRIIAAPILAVAVYFVVSKATQRSLQAGSG